MNFKSQIAHILSKLTLIEEEKIESQIEVPPNPDMGDYAFPCFILSKAMKKNPIQIAADLADTINNRLTEKEFSFLSNVKNINAYLNFTLNREEYAKGILLKVPYFEKTNQKIMIEHSQPNTHKEFHVGHLRNVCLGHSIIQILKFKGNEVISANYIGDIGTHVAKALWCLEKFHSNDEIPDNKGKYLGKIYVEASSKIAQNEEEYSREVSEILQKLESRESEITALWEKTRLWSLSDFKNIYRDLGVHFDVWFFESEEDEDGRKIANELLSKGIAKMSNSAVIVDLEHKNQGVALILKTDGTTLYLTKDLSLAIKKFKEHMIDKSIYIVDSRQSLHLSQAFSILQLMGFNKDMIHVSYEFVSTKNGPIASRHGNVFLYEDLKTRMVESIINETKKRHENWPDEKILENSKILSDAALKFGMLKIDNNKEIIFDESEWLDLEGETGPYVLYAIARINSIARKAKEKDIHSSKRINYARLDSKDDADIIRLIEREQTVIDEAGNNYKPSVIARYTLELAQKVNEYYHANQIIQEDVELAKARLHLLERLRETMIRCLKLLGIQSVDEM